MLRKVLPLLAVLAIAAARPAAAQKLKVGDPAPKLEVKQFVKGTPVTTLEKGKLYVVEFWATWCGPCRATIPHLTELQKKHPEVTFIGVSVWEQDQSAVTPFVKQMGPKMEYRVAMDAIPAGGDGDSGKMATNWMKAAGQNGIPTAFIVNKEGKIAWIGHPAGMDETLGKVVAGNFNIQDALAQQEKEAKVRAKIQALGPKIQAAAQANKPLDAVAAIDAAVKETPELEEVVGFPKFRFLMMADPAKALAYGTRLVDVVYKDNIQALNQISWTLVAPEAPKPSGEAAVVALRAAQRADQVSQSKDPAIADTLARAYFVSGDIAKAIETQERAIAQAKGTALENEQELKDRLAEYKKAAGK